MRALAVLLDLILMGCAIFVLASGGSGDAWVWIALMSASTLLIKDVSA